ncbi:hypothetical protein SELMODRAFT_404366 [Selaginella moellendorffii]|uniref:Uncharacterized protein n=1 Tax=Selaginella moellendorffii TaxID=88036 RepID=D8QV37_SELML|nr:hypothetical protein SELMODRAFT_404366 [Selaginella moellendorffii]
MPICDEGDIAGSESLFDPYRTILGGYWSALEIRWIGTASSSSKPQIVVHGTRRKLSSLAQVLQKASFVIGGQAFTALAIQFKHKAPAHRAQNRQGVHHRSSAAEFSAPQLHPSISWTRHDKVLIPCSTLMCRIYLRLLSGKFLSFRNVSIVAFGFSVPIPVSWNAIDLLKPNYIL